MGSWISELSLAEKKIILYVMIDIYNHRSHSNECRELYIEKIAQYFNLSQSLHQIEYMDASTVKTLLRICEKTVKPILFRLISYFIIDNTSTSWSYFKEIAKEYNWGNCSYVFWLTQHDLLDNYYLIQGHDYAYLSAESSTENAKDENIDKEEIPENRDIPIYTKEVCDYEKFIINEIFYKDL